MKFISHRGNIHGREIESENHPRKIEECLELEFEVEIDVWGIGGMLFLGHDKPDYQVSIDFLQREKIWCHAKNVEVLSIFANNPKIHYFWHQEDDYTITSRGIIWVYPGKFLPNESVCVMPERASYSYNQLNSCFGICSDDIFNFRKRHSK